MPSTGTIVLLAAAGAALLLASSSKADADVPTPTPDPPKPTPDPEGPPKPKPTAIVFEIRKGYFADNVLDNGFYYGPDWIIQGNVTATQVAGGAVGKFLTAQGAVDAAKAAGFAPVLRLSHFKLGQGAAGPATTVLALTSVPGAGLVHRGALRSDGSWTIATSTGVQVAQGSGETKFLNAWNLYTQGGVDGVIIRAGVFHGLSVRMPGCAPGFPQRWCYSTTWQPGFQHHNASSRKDALAKAIARLRAGG